MNNSPPPIFILSIPRSFTSLIGTMLGQHPETYGVPELNLFVEDTLGELADRMIDVYHIQLHGLLRAVSELYTGEQTIASVDMAHRWMASRLSRSTGDIYKELCQKVAPLRTVDKSPAYSANRERLDRIRQAFPNAYYLHLLRHPFGSGKSLMKLESGQLMATLAESIDYSQGSPILDPQILWHRMHATILDFLETIPPQQKMRLRGEEILGSPQKYFESICHWLGLSWDEMVYEAMLHPELSPYACPGPFGAQLGNDPNFLNRPAFRPQKVVPNSLDWPLPWRSDNRGFFPHVIELARELGYS